jgi:type I restriction enzyme R subunit
MKELQLQDKYLMHFLAQRTDGLQYQEVKANTVSADKLVIEEDLLVFLRETKLNKDSFRKVVRKHFGNDERALLADFLENIVTKRMETTMNTAIFINNNKTVTFKGEKFHLFYPSETQTSDDALFDENIFSVVQEMTYTFWYQKKRIYSFRPDISFFVNGIYLGYSELKSVYNNQNARKDGRLKVIKNYQDAVAEYDKLALQNDNDKSIRRAFLKIFEKAIHLTTTDLTDTFVIRNINDYHDMARAIVKDGFKNDKNQTYRNTILDKAFKAYPLRNVQETDKQIRFEEAFRALYGKKMIEKEILYYNFIEREYERQGKTKKYKHNDGRLIAPRPKQKFGVDKIMGKIGEFLEHEQEDDYFNKKLKAELDAQGIGEKLQKSLIEKRMKYLNNKNIYSLLLQYAAGFGKSNIIGWAALQLKDLKEGKGYVYDKIIIVVDRLQLRDQIDTKMHNMNINKSMFIEASDKRSFETAMKTDVRIVVVNVQKFYEVEKIFDAEVTEKLASMRIVFLIDEVHRSQSGSQHEEMITLFDTLQSSFDNSTTYVKKRQKKNLIIGFTATPSNNILSRFGEFSHYAENQAIFKPFDFYTMSQAIQDGYILNPIDGIVPVSAKMYYELPESEPKGFEGDTQYEQVAEPTVNYRIRNKNIYENPHRIDAISEFIVQRLVTMVYPQIRGTAKAMLAVSSIDAAIMYHQRITEHYAAIVQQKKHDRFKDVPIFIVYSNSDNQKHINPTLLNGGKKEREVLQSFQFDKNGLVIVVDKLQTGFDEPKLQTLFLDKEINGINAIQTISRVNRTTKYKSYCKIVDFSHQNVNVSNIKSAFEQFSNVVVSDFNPLENEKRMIEIYEDLKVHSLYSTYFKTFQTEKQKPEKQQDVTVFLSMETAFIQYINANEETAASLKKSVNRYFHLLRLLRFVIEMEDKYTDELFIDFWYRFNNVFNQTKPNHGITDDVTIYYDEVIGIVAPPEANENGGNGGENTGDGGNGNGTQLDIFKAIAQRNQTEAEIEKLIEKFKAHLENLFTYIETEKGGSRLIAKIKAKANTSTFTNDEVQSEFNKLYRKFIRRNRGTLSAFFIKETEAMLGQLCDMFEGRVRE